jgi:hypothetical protein
MADSKKLSFSKLPILNSFSRKFQGLVLGWDGSIDVEGVDFAQPILSSGCPTEDEFTAENTKNVFLAVNSSYDRQTDNPFGWAK